ncbi:hypothetical protein A2707_02890 [Candidatus Saccharibacteria bacterium RIFCSPHIGHO2_01_FULL_45_15]|nr:MAG: hypothetical protein A2707_02890 [Candidatus Saccharibacteria bacterium RIFCSPHIGHO2_01_FULL_45_15]OGL27060.1 MAG: hypothetical protein A3C39_00740 [Candidatus Saccharibacteria bacterium RIFCSPHIGHO2_02_FULL_46_12]OGL31871.1 MAG: hypothetical protein A3E76_03485 [Candidatus Saccharibacteria bacterium RIFCSPHIGHO2_12_FULL_44_22]
MSSHLTVGQKAPQFTRLDTSGRSIALSDYSKSFVLVAFLRYSGCPWCNLAVHRLAMEYPLLKESKCEVITFIQSSKESIQENIFDRHNVTPLFPIIADASMEMYAVYDVTGSAIRGLRHHIKNIPSWVKAVSKEGFAQTSIDGHFFLAPATFLLSPGEQQIIRIDYDADLYKHESFTNIYDAISSYNLYGLNT